MAPQHMLEPLCTTTLLTTYFIKPYVSIQHMCQSTVPYLPDRKSVV